MSETLNERAIFHIQVEMEKLGIAEKKWSVGLCDRGTLDELAYWPMGEDTLWKMSKSEASEEYRKYFAVIQLRSPSAQAGEIDEKIAKAWAGHPNYHVIGSAKNFLDKAQSAIKLISQYVPECCQAELALASKTKAEDGATQMK